MNYKQEKALMVTAWIAWVGWAMFGAWYAKHYIHGCQSMLVSFAIPIYCVVWMLAGPAFHDWQNAWEGRKKKQLALKEAERVRLGKLLSVR